ncbi:PAS domain-containing protein [Spirochaeta isovalerica]|uniref:PAS domain S-box-containing protein n=1 Tax=Spirochaeta isovalerica TaxID=150 RepID=A0A841R641_9SPIO|nr:PAS domain-containing protein [Spirochaeta isovalerica]MBB6478627.1 PAS domain S-box-containing protein [Spirochaeta isovalerica]
MENEFDSELLSRLKVKGVDSNFIEHLLSSLFNTFPDHIYIKDRNSRFLLINESLTKVFNLNSPDEAVGKSDYDFFTEEHAGITYREEQEIMDCGRGMTNYVEKETWEDGSISWVASTKVPFRDEEGKVIGIFGISRDITARRQAEIDKNNRARELDCFIKISQIAKSKEVSFEGHIKEIASLIPEFLSHAQIASVRIVVGNKSFKSRDFHETENKRLFPVRDGSSKVGVLEVFLERKDKEIENTTEQVLNLIADRLNEIIQKRWIEKDLRKWEHILKDAEDHMDLYP